MNSWMLWVDSEATILLAVDWYYGHCKAKYIIGISLMTDWKRPLYLSFIRVTNGSPVSPTLPQLFFSDFRNSKLMN